MSCISINSNWRPHTVWTDSMRSYCRPVCIKINVVDTWSLWYLLYMKLTERQGEREKEIAGFTVIELNSPAKITVSTYSSPPTVAFYLPWCQRSARSLQSFWSRGEKTTSEPECLSISSRNLRVLFLKLNINIRHTSLWLSDNGSRLNSWLLKQWLLTLIQTQLLCSGYPKFNQLWISW